MAAFTVKATYRSETRKFSFPDSTFPTYDQLYSQVSTPVSPRSCMMTYRSPHSCIGSSPYPTPSIYPSFSSPLVILPMLAF